MYQRGTSAVTVVISVAAGLTVLYAGYSFVGMLTAPDITEDISQATNVGTTSAPAQQQKAQSFVSFDDNFYRSEGEFYFRIPSGVDEDGNATYTYIKADNIADVKTFRRVPVVGGTDGSITGKVTGQGTMPAFYMDSQHVYFFTGTSVQILTGADPNTFQVLTPVYAKDANNVYVVQTTCDANGNCTGTVSVIPGANPPTFQTFHDTTAPDPDGSGTVTYDAKDDKNIYYYGTWVGPLPDPDDHSVHPDTDNPVLISP